MKTLKNEIIEVKIGPNRCWAYCYRHQVVRKTEMAIARISNRWYSLKRKIGERFFRFDSHLKNLDEKYGYKG